MATRKSSKPKLAAVTADTSPRRITYAGDSCSLLGNVPAIFENLPTVRYDPAILAERIDCDVAGKDHALERLGSAHHAVNAAVALIGKLLTSQDSAVVGLEDHDVSEMGFTLCGLSHMAQQIVDAMERLEQATPMQESKAGARHG